MPLEDGVTRLEDEVDIFRGRLTGGSLSDS
jgi:hypothetical protein